MVPWPGRQGGFGPEKTLKQGAQGQLKSPEHRWGVGRYSVLGGKAWKEARNPPTLPAAIQSSWALEVPCVSWLTFPLLFPNSSGPK